MFPAPTCQTCNTDDYLHYSKYTPARIERTTMRTAQGSIPRTERIDPVVYFTCMKCGLRNGHSVDESWVLPTSSPRVQPDRPYYQMDDGSIVIR